MSTTIDCVKTMLKKVNLHNAAGQIEEILITPLNQSISYEKFLEELLLCEIKGREEKRFERRLRHASFRNIRLLSNLI